MEFFPAANRILFLFVFRISLTGYVKWAIKRFSFQFVAGGTVIISIISRKFINLISYTALISKQSKSNVKVQDSLSFFDQTRFRVHKRVF